MKRILVCGAGGFIGYHLVNFLKYYDFEVIGVDLKLPEFGKSEADRFILGDLRDQEFCSKIFRFTRGVKYFDEVYQLAADMGGAGYIFTKDNDANVMTNSVLINLNVLRYYESYEKIFYSSSACIYPEYNQLDPDNPNCAESSAYPAAPDSEYGWEKLFSERLYLAYNRNNNLPVRIARFHNVYGPFGSWDNGKEKAPAAICRKIAMAKDGTSVEIWGDGKQTRSFTFIDDCLACMRKFMDSNFIGPVNIGSDEMISINDLTRLVINISGKNLKINNVEGPLGVRGRNSDNKLIYEKLGWKPIVKLEEGMPILYSWIDKQVKEKYSGGK